LPLRYARRDVGDVDARAKECLAIRCRRRCH
jgi:hypothetical protein